MTSLIPDSIFQRQHCFADALVQNKDDSGIIPVSMEEAHMTTNWGENVPGAEQLALSDFAAQLEAHVALDNSKDTKTENIREEAEILLSLLSAKPPSQSPSIDEDDDTYFPEYQEDLIRRDPSFSFTCPLLSLENSSDSQPDCIATQGSSDGSTTTEDSLPSSKDTTSVPALLLGRQLLGDGSPEETDKTRETIARNIALSFHKAVEWRIQTWIHSLARILVQREKSLEEAHASDDIIRELLDTAEARVVLCLQKAASEIKILDAKVSFRVLSQRINSSQEWSPQGGPPPLKKCKVDDVASLQIESSEYRYTVAHVLTFEATMHLKTPAGYTEVTVEAPGIIEGSFLSSDLGEDILTGISVEIDTNVVAKAIERSSRIVARTATHAVIPTNEEEFEDEEEEDSPQEETEELAPSLTIDSQTNSEDEATEAALVTPRKTASPTMYEVSDRFPMLPDDLDSEAKDVIRMVSPQPRSPDYMSFNFTPRTPQTTSDKSDGPLNLVSPPPPPHSNLVSPPTPSSKSSSEDEKSPLLSARKSPSLPALLQAASAAMKTC